MLKRTSDVIYSLFGLLILAVPMVLIALLIKLTSRGPVLFRQRRLGLNGKPFTIVKFRTMSEMRDSAAALLPDAQRITRLGRLLRRSSLDELPELLNVLRGEMSMVG